MSDVHFEIVGKAGLIALTRPKALNALARAMCHDMCAALEEWAKDDRVERVAIRGEGKAFSAGGDIRAVYEDRDAAPGYFADEYRLDAMVAHFPKPYVALIDGIVMGGGAGVSLHGSHRLVGENVLFAMPEVGIGLFPDVGVRHVLARLRGESGTYLGLTGLRLRRDDVAALGLATHALASERMDAALDRVAHARALDGALDELAEDVAPWPDSDFKAIDAVFAGDSVPEIIERAEAGAADNERVALAAEAMRGKSPTSMAVTLASLRRAADETIDETLVSDYRVVRQILLGHDFFEGIRAVLIDKDNAPRWSPATHEGVDADMVAAHFEEPEGGDLVLPPRPGTA